MIIGDLFQLHFYVSYEREEKYRNGAAGEGGEKEEVRWMIYIHHYT
jgi:hypothetical protein